MSKLLLLNVLLGLMLVASLYFNFGLYLEYKNIEQLKGENQYVFEMYKACEGHRMYLAHILDEFHIDYLH